MSEQKIKKEAAVYFLSISLLLAAAPHLRAENKNELRLYYKLQSVIPRPAYYAKLQYFFKRQSADSYYLLQGFACNTGGFIPSLTIANLRAAYTRDFLQKAGLPENRLKIASGFVFPDSPKALHRRIELRSFPDQKKWRAAYKAAQSQLKIGNEDPVKREDKTWEELKFVLAFIGSLVFLRFLFVLLSFLKKNKHRLSRSQAKALESLTEREIKPIVGRGPLPSLRSVKAFLENPRRFHDMMQSQKSKKQKKTVEGISIAGIIQPQFKEKNLKQLAKAPVHALTGLTPRHGRLLKEAFGVETVEDFAKLKYVEVAKAIVILSRWES